MIDDALFTRLAALDARSLATVRLSTLQPLIDAQQKFARAEIGEREMLAVALAVNDAFGQLPVRPGMTRSEVEVVVGRNRDDTRTAIRERLKDL